MRWLGLVVGHSLRDLLAETILCHGQKDRGEIGGAVQPNKWDIYIYTNTYDLFIYSFIYLFIYLFIYFIYSCICLFIYLFI